jgi:hypothetical protein
MFSAALAICLYDGYSNDDDFGMIRLILGNIRAIDPTLDRAYQVIQDVAFWVAFHNSTMKDGHLILDVPFVSDSDVSSMWNAANFVAMVKFELVMYAGLRAAKAARDASVSGLGVIGVLLSIAGLITGPTGAGAIAIAVISVAVGLLSVPNDLQSFLGLKPPSRVSWGMENELKNDKETPYKGVLIEREGAGIKEYRPERNTFYDTGLMSHYFSVKLDEVMGTVKAGGNNILMGDLVRALDEYFTKIDFFEYGGDNEVIGSDIMAKLFNGGFAKKESSDTNYGYVPFKKKRYNNLPVIPKP